MNGDGATVLSVLVVAGYPALRAGLNTLLAFESDLAPIDESSLGDHDPDVIVVEASALSENALDDLTDRYPSIPLVLIGVNLDAGDEISLSYPGGYLPSDIDGPGLAATVRAVAQGLTVLAPGLVLRQTATGVKTTGPLETGLLTPREREVLLLVAEGLPNKAIARELGISEHTAKFHVGSVLGKLGASSRAEAVTIATRRGILSV